MANNVFLIIEEDKYRRAILIYKGELRGDHSIAEVEEWGVAVETLPSE